jgi:hypothetical protein
MSSVPTDAPLLDATEVNAGSAIDYEALVTEDHKPVDRIFVEKLYRLLTHTLYASWQGHPAGQPFLVLANVGWFYEEKTSAVVPDCLLSLGVSCPENLQVKEGHSYYQWKMGKPPDVIIEIVSDRLGGEEAFKKDLYAQRGVSFYAVYDPKHLLSEDTLRTYELRDGTYQLTEPGPWKSVGLGLRLWPGRFEGHEDYWLRWCDSRGDIIPTAEERAAQDRELARQAEERALKDRELARQEKERAAQAEELAMREKERAAQAEERARQEKERAAQAEELAMREKERAAQAEERARQERELARQAQERLAALEAELRLLKSKPDPETP